MSNTVETQRGQAQELRITWFEEGQGGPRIDLTGATVTAKDFKPSVLGDAAIIITDATQGECLMSLTRDQAAQLRTGRVSWFRLEAVFPGGDNRVTPQIFINVS